MSMIDDVRVLLQDVVAPDLKALSARMDAVEASLKQGFEAVNKRFEGIEQMAALRHEALLSRFDSAIASANANHEATLKALNMDRRMEQLKLAVAAQTQHKERHA